MRCPNLTQKIEVRGHEPISRASQTRLPRLTSWHSGDLSGEKDLPGHKKITIFVQHFNVSTKLARVGLGEKDCGASKTFSFMVGKDSFSFEAGNCFHVCTDGNALPWMFKDDTDFINGINRIGICSHITGIKVISYVLMDNHLHFLLCGPMPLCKEFITRYKHLTGKYIYSRYSIKGHLRGLPTGIIPIEDQENLLAVIAYIDRNPVVAGYRYLPSEYSWGTARYVFRDSTRWEIEDVETPNKGCTCKGVVSLDKISALERYEKLGTKANLPHQWVLDGRGMIQPASFFSPAIIETLFKSPARYIYHLSKKLEGEIDATIHNGKKSFLPDKELRPAVAELAATLFGTADVRTLNIASRLLIARKLRYEYASTHKQIARMLHLDAEMLKGYV